MKSSLSRLLFPLLAVGLLCSNAALADEKPLTKSDVEAIVKQVISDNPELLIDSVTNYQKKKATEDLQKASKGIVEHKKELNSDPVSPTVGSADADVTIVEFFDYHCGYCKQFLPVITQLSNEDSKVRLVFKEFPILAPDSAIAAKAALAVYSIDKTKYLAYHTALMKMSGTFTAENLADKADSVGIDKDAFKKALADPAWEKELLKNRELASTLYISGTPAIIVGDELIPGVIPISELKKKIAAVRAGTKK